MEKNKRKLKIEIGHKFRCFLPKFVKMRLIASLFMLMYKLLIS